MRLRVCGLIYARICVYRSEKNFLRSCADWRTGTCANGQSGGCHSASAISGTSRLKKTVSCASQNWHIVHMYCIKRNSTKLLYVLVTIPLKTLHCHIYDDLAAGTVPIDRDRTQSSTVHLNCDFCHSTGLLSYN